MAQEQSLDMFRGEDRTLALAARDSTNAASNLSGKTITWGITYPPYAPEWRSPVFTKTGTITDSANGLYTVTVAAADTQGLCPGNYIHQAYTTDSGGAIALVTEGTFHLRATLLGT